MSDSTAQTVRQLKLKTGVVRRYFKEEQTYRVEVTEAKARLQKFKDNNADGADIRAAERVVKDSEQMVPRTQKSLGEAAEALQDLVDALSGEESISSTQEYTDAVAQLRTVNDATKANGS